MKKGDEMGEYYAFRGSRFSASYEMGRLGRGHLWEQKLALGRDGRKMERPRNPEGYTVEVTNLLTLCENVGLQVLRMVKKRAHSWRKDSVIDVVLSTPPFLHDRAGLLATVKPIDSHFSR